MSPWSTRFSVTSNPSVSDMPLQTTRRERVILAIVAALLLLGFLGLLVL